MKVTVCELPNRSDELNAAWDRLVEHVQFHGSDLVLLPEMPFYRWLSQSREVDAKEWDRAVSAHEKWIGRLDELAPATVVSSRPVLEDGLRRNMGFVWEQSTGTRNCHSKFYLPDEPGFWEATWYQRGDGEFCLARTEKAAFGFLICTELWFPEHARDYGKGGAHFIVCSRATPTGTAQKWLAGGRAAAVISGAFCLSSNLSGPTDEGRDFSGVGWIAEPDQGEILGQTSLEQPFLTLDVDLGAVDRARSTYPRYVVDDPV